VKKSGWTQSGGLATGSTMRSLFSRILLSNWAMLLAMLFLAIIVDLLEKVIEPEYWMVLLLFYIITVMFAAMFLSYHIAKSVTDQLSLIEKKARELNAGDFGTEISSPEIKELADLTASINAMSDRLKNQFNDLSLEKEKFNSLLQNLKEGVFAIDHNQKLLFQNKNTPIDLILPNSQFLDIEKAVTNSTFKNFLLEHINTKTEGKEDLEINSRHYGVRIYPLKSNESSYLFIGVVRDKTQERQSQIFREEFIQNASHELKTPITSIKGYAETLGIKLKLEEGMPEKRFLQAIMRNVDRMIRIVEDMLTITKIDSYSSMYQPENFHLSTLVENFRLTVDGYLKPRGQTLVINIPENLKIHADMVLIEHLLLNLLSNASSYSPDNSTITFEVAQDDDFVIMKIKDEGIGISADDSKRIFERFYRVDKNRSRKEGGTGLGLAIVKHIVKLHKGKISVEKNVPQGSVFSVSIPRNYTRGNGIPASTTTGLISH